MNIVTGITELNPYIYAQLTFDMSTKSIQWGKNFLFNRCDGTIGFTYAKERVGSLPHIIYKN